MAAVLVAVTLLVGATYWVVYRPLNGIERRLVGTWRNTTVGVVFTFHSDRSVSGGALATGGPWYVRGKKLYVADSPLEEVVQSLFRPVDDSSIITFEDDDHVTVFVPLNGGTFHWQRVKGD